LKRDLIVSFLLVIIFGLTLVSSVLAQESNPELPNDDAVNAIAKELYCPVCENVPLDVCGTQACAEWRELIREKLAEGWSETQIKEYFSDQYGARVLAEPPRSGLNWLVYIVPPLAFFAGVYILYRGFKTWRQMAPAALPEIQSDDQEEPVDEYMARLEEELRRSDQ
jgi:cytochrome c-type biogenesis protein CcmH